MEKLWPFVARADSSRELKDAEILQSCRDDGLLDGADHLIEMEMTFSSNALYNLDEPNRQADDPTKLGAYHDQVVLNFQATTCLFTALKI